MNTYVIDTNVLVHDYNAFDNVIQGNKVIIPYVVLEELDNLKTKNDSVGVSARHSIRRIEEELIKANNNVWIVHSLQTRAIPDDRILDVCEQYPDSTLITKDVCLRTKARALGISVEDYRSDKVTVSNLYSGVMLEYVPPSVVDKVFSEKQLVLKERAFTTSSNYYPNQAVVLVDLANEKTKCITIHKDGVLHLIDNKLAPFGLNCANLEQQIAANLLLDPSIDLVTITGGAGSGKSLMAVACALEAVLERGEYKKLSVARPIMPFQKDIGYLP